MNFYDGMMAMIMAMIMAMMFLLVLLDNDLIFTMAWSFFHVGMVLSSKIWSSPQDSICVSTKT